jgi:UDP-3-O-[3-hydroxymyristoyl] glucosamine N-acyltransferase
MSHTAKELADHVGASIEGNGSLQISGCASAANARVGDIIFVDGAKHLDAAARSAAACVILAPGVELSGKTILRATNPRLAFAKIMAWMYPEQRIVSGIHPTAVVAATAKLGDGVGVGPYAVIEDGAEIGAGSEIGAHCFVGRGARIGAACRLYPRVTLYAGVHLGSLVILHSGAVVGSDGFGFVPTGNGYFKFPQIGIVEIGDDVEIGANTTIDRGALDTTRLGNGVKIDNLVHIGHNVEIGENTAIAAQTGMAGSTVIGRNAMIGGQVGIGGHCRIEDGAILGSGAGVLPGKILRGGVPMWGIPARPLDEYKEINAWFSRLPELGERVRKLEEAANRK